MEDYVWEFTNKRKLRKKEFIAYIEKKVFKTIRKYSLMPNSKVFSVEDSEVINNVVLRHILRKKFKVGSSNPNTSTKNQSQIAEEIMRNALAGNFVSIIPSEKFRAPLFSVSDEELKTYALINNLKFKEREKDEEMQKFFEKFIKKNPDLEKNIIRASIQFSEGLKKSHQV